MRDPARRLDLDLDPIVVLLETTDARREFDLDVRQHLQPTEGYIGQLVLLALHDIRKARVILQHSEIEFGDDGAAGTIPDAELGFDQAPPGHLFHQSEIFENLERGGVGGGRPRAVIDTGLRFEKPNLQSLPGERERRHHADRAATRNDDGTFGLHIRSRVRGVKSCRRPRGVAYAETAMLTRPRNSLPVAWLTCDGNLAVKADDLARLFPAGYKPHCLLPSCTACPAGAVVIRPAPSADAPE